MTTLDKIMELKQEGVPDDQIYIRLQNEGISPREINDSLNQARIKYAISNGSQTLNSPYQDQMTNNPAPLPSINQENQIPEAPSPNMYQEQQDYSNQGYYPETEQYQNYYPESPNTYSESDYYPSGAQDTQTISEIAEQVVIERTEDIVKRINELTSLSNYAQDKIAEIDRRLKRIEDSIDKLQQAIIEKIGKFGNSTEQIHQDLDNLHETVASLMNPLIDNVNELKKIKKKKD